MSQVKWNLRAPRALSFLVLMGAGLACSDPVSGPMTVGDASPRALKGDYGAWTQALSAELAPPGASASFNTAALDGCPYIAPDGKTSGNAEPPRLASAQTGRSQRRVMAPGSSTSPAIRW